MNDPVANLDEAVAVLKERARPLLSAWFARGVDLYFETGQPLDQCLGLAPVDRAEAIRWRDKHLTDAYRHAGAVRCLGLQIRRFESSIWPRIRREVLQPQSLTPLQRELFHAFKCGINVPSSKSQLAEIVSGADVRPDSECDAI